MATTRAFTSESGRRFEGTEILSVTVGFHYLDVDYDEVDVLYDVSQDGMVSDFHGDVTRL